MPGAGIKFTTRLRVQHLNDPAMTAPLIYSSNYSFKTQKMLLFTWFFRFYLAQRAATFTLLRRSLHRLLCTGNGRHGVVRFLGSAIKAMDWNGHQCGVVTQDKWLQTVTLHCYKHIILMEMYCNFNIYLHEKNQSRGKTRQKVQL